MRTICLALLLLVVVGCGSSGETRQEQGSREFDICMKQADRIAETQGSAAATDHMDACRDALASGTY